MSTNIYRIFFGALVSKANHTSAALEKHKSNRIYTLAVTSCRFSRPIIIRNVQQLLQTIIKQYLQLLSRHFVHTVHMLKQAMYSNFSAAVAVAMLCANSVRARKIDMENMCIRTKGKWQ